MNRTVAYAVFALLLASTARGSAPNESGRRFLWDQANSQMCSARTPAEFGKAAATYRRLLASGVRNGPLFYNLGTALLKAGEYEPATAALLRAERYTGSTPEIRQNLLLALAREDPNATVSLPWHRFPLFWHYGLSGATRVAVAATAFSLFWAALALARAGVRPARPFAVLCLCAFVLFGSSVLTTWHDEQSADQPPPAAAHAKGKAAP